MTDLPRSTDPFASTPDPALYVPRRASETVISTLISLLRVGSIQLALQGPAGIGKTLVLRLVAARLEGELRTLYLPHPTLPMDEIAAFILGLLDEPAGGCPEEALENLARDLEQRGSSLAVLVDDAASMPLETAGYLRRLAAELQPALRLVFSLTDDPRAQDLIESDDSGIAIVPFATAMNLDETGEYIRSRLVGAERAPGECAAFDEEVVASIHRRAKGVPQLVNVHAALMLRELERSEAVEEPAGESSEPDRPAAAAARAAQDPTRPGVKTPTSSPNGRPPSDPEIHPPVSAPPSRRWRAAATALLMGALVSAYFVGQWSGHQRAESPLHDSTAAPSDSTAAQFDSTAAPSDSTAAQFDSTAAQSAPPPPRMSAPSPAVPLRQPTGLPPELRAAPAVPGTRSIAVGIETEDGALVQVDGAELGEAPIGPIRLDPGPHWFRATLPNGRVVERAVSIDPDNTQVDLR